MYVFSGHLTSCSNSTSCSINFSSLGILGPISSFLLIPSDLWNTVQILVGKYIFLQRFQGRSQKASAEQSTSQTWFQQAQPGTTVGSVHMPHAGNPFRPAHRENGKQGKHSDRILSGAPVTTAPSQL